MCAHTVSHTVGHMLVKNFHVRFVINGRRVEYNCLHSLTHPVRELKAALYSIFLNANHTFFLDSNQGGALMDNTALDKMTEDEGKCEDDCDNLAKPIITKDTNLETDDAVNINTNDKAKNGIYMSPAGMATRNNEVPGRDSFNTPTVLNNGIYMSTPRRMSGDEMPRSHENDGSDSTNKLRGKNCGIYMTPNQDTSKHD